MNDITWIRRRFNLAESMRKTEIIPELVTGMKEILVHYEIDKSVKKSIKSVPY